MISKSEIKLINSLAHKKYRQLNKSFCIEGERLVSEAVNSNFKIRQIFLTHGFAAKPQHKKIINQLIEKKIAANPVTEKEMKNIAETVSPSGILAICELPELLPPDINKSANWLYLDEVQDPGNLGTLLRSTNWFGVKNVALSGNCIDAYNSKVLRSGMGGHFNLHIFENVSLDLFKDSSHTIIGAFQSGVDINSIDRKELKPWVLVIGNEAHGISQVNVNYIDVMVTIPKIGCGESLNAAVAGSILLNHLTNPV